MNQDEIKAKLIERFGEAAVTDTVLFRDQLTVTVPQDAILDICRFLKTDPDLSFDFLSFVAGMDRHPESPRFEVVYQLNSLKYHHRFRVKARLTEESTEGPCIESVVPIWATADWHERETAEMYGITFLNHPDPRKLLLPDNWNVHPLRKDFPLQGTEEDTPDLPA